MDCNVGMREFPDNYFDLAVVDPPYYSGPEKRIQYGSKRSPIGVSHTYQPSAKAWSIPEAAYFQELERVSKNQIIWGCNYFYWHFPPGRIIWDKCNDSSFLSNCEIASCSLHKSVRLYRYMWNGMMQGKSVNEGWRQQGNKALNERRIHPTQKPVNLYRWIIQQYILQGWKILDTHVGSASSLIAYEEAKLPYVGFEIDPLRYDSARNRLKEYKEQRTLSDYGILP